MGYGTVKHNIAGYGIIAYGTVRYGIPMDGIRAYGVVRSGINEHCEGRYCDVRDRQAWHHGIWSWMYGIMMYGIVWCATARYGNI